MSYVDKVKVGNTTYDIQDAGAVRAVTGKGLSTNDFTDAEKAKLAGVEAGAQVNVDPEWSDIKHKPTTVAGYGITNAYTKDEVDTALDGKANKATTLAGYGITNAYTKDAVDSKLSDKVDKVRGKGLSTNDFTNAEKTKLAGIEAGAQVNVAPYWSDVQDKPTTIAGYGLTDDLNTALAGKVDVVSGKGLSTNDYTDADKLKLQATNVMYCTCNTSGDEAEKEITIVSPAGAELNYRDTAILCIKFSETNTSERTYFNINGTHYSVAVYGKIVQGGNRDYYGFANVPLLYMLYNGTIHYICGLEDIDTDTDTDTYTSAICDTPGDAQTKRAKCTDYVLRDGNYLHIIMKNDNTAQGCLFLTVGDTARGMIFINDVMSSDTNYTLPAGSYIIYYNNYNYYFRTDGKIPNITAVPTDAYTKGETDALLEYKADKATTYTKSEIDTKLANIEGATPEWDDVQHKPKTIAGYGIADAYTKSEVDAAIAGSTPNWDGIRNKPTTIAGYGLTDAYTKGQVDTALAGKVDKVSGKGLSTNDYTNAEKTKLAGIEAGAQANVDPDWSDVQNKPTTLSGYGIANAYTKGEVDTALAGKAAVATTLAGYGITDAYTRSEVNAAIAGVDVGDPDWSDVQNKPTTVAGFGITDAYTKSETDSALAGKVDTVSGKGLSTNDYTDAEKAKVAAMPGISISGNKLVISTLA